MISAGKSPEEEDHAGIAKATSATQNKSAILFDMNSTKEGINYD